MCVWWGRIHVVGEDGPNRSCSTLLDTDRTSDVNIIHISYVTRNNVTNQQEASLFANHTLCS